MSEGEGGKKASARKGGNSPKAVVFNKINVMMLIGREGKGQTEFFPDCSFVSSWVNNHASSVLQWPKLAFHILACSPGIAGQPGRLLDCWD